MLSKKINLIKVHGEFKKEKVHDEEIRTCRNDKTKHPLLSIFQFHEIVYTIFLLQNGIKLVMMCGYLKWKHNNNTQLSIAKKMFSDFLWCLDNTQVVNSLFAKIYEQALQVFSNLLFVYYYCYKLSLLLT